MKSGNILILILLLIIITLTCTSANATFNYSEYMNEPVRWCNLDTISLIIDKSASTHFMDNYNYDFIELTEKAFDIWMDQGKLPVSLLIKDGNCEEAKLDEICVRVTNRKVRDEFLAKTYVMNDPQTGYIYTVDIKFYDDVSYGSEFLLLHVITHELGHAWGLAHSEIEEALMFPLVSLRYDKDVFLHQDDIDTVVELYDFKTPATDDDTLETASSCSVSPKMLNKTSSFDLISSLVFPPSGDNKKKKEAKMPLYNAGKIKELLFLGNDFELISVK